MFKMVRRSKIGFRIVLGFIIMILLLLVVSGNAFINFSSITNETQILSDTAQAKYHTLLARDFVNSYEKEKTDSAKDRVNGELQLAIDTANKAMEGIDSIDEKAVLVELTDKLTAFQASFKEIVDSQVLMEESFVEREAASSSAESFTKQILRLQANSVMNSKDIEKSNAEFEVYIIARNGYDEFLRAEIEVANYMHTPSIEIYNKAVEYFNSSLALIQESMDTTTNPLYSITAEPSITSVNDYLVALEDYKEINALQQTKYRELATISEDVSLIAEQAQNNVEASIEAMKNRANLLIIIVALLSLVVALVSTYIISTSIRVPLKSYIEKLKRFGAGDLTVEFDQEGKDELTEMGQALSAMEKNLSQIINQLIVSAHEFKHISQEAIVRTKDNNESIEVALDKTLSLSSENEDSLSNVALSIKEISKGTNSSVAATMESAAVATETKKRSEQVVDNMHDVDIEINQVGKQSTNISEKMKDVASSILEISSFVSRIAEIADQTNLLSLNAAIEAARAGEQGKGFSVVADEVRKLADESNIASTEINRIIQILNEHSNGALNEIKASEESINRVVVTTAETAKGMEQSLEEIDQLSSSMESIASVTEEQASSSEEILSTTESLIEISNEVAKKLHEVNEVVKASSMTTEEDLNNIISNASSFVDLLSYFNIKN